MGYFYGRDLFLFYAYYSTLRINFNMIIDNFICLLAGIVLLLIANRWFLSYWDG